jgi:molecular chaperone HtpG
MSTKEKRGFETEAQQLLQLMIHSLYSNKEIFLRELISNASDAADKLRYEALKQPALYDGDAELKIWISYDKEAKTLTIRDNGIGMTWEDVIQNLGTIARSGTKEFMKALSADHAKTTGLIGQFGVGFYSAFMVADQVVVKTRRAGSDVAEGVCWSSDGGGEYEVEKIECPQRGTEIILHLKDTESEFLDPSRLKHIVTKYSDHIALPIVMPTELSPYATEEEKKQFEAGELPPEEVINRATALWTMDKKEITDEQYQDLYKHMSHDFADAMTWVHNRVEGKQEYISLLFIPSRPPFDLFQMDKPRGLKLYVNRVFIMDNAEQFLPHYLRFVRGVVDSSDLPLNVSREILQNNPMIDTMKSAIVKRVLGLLEKMAEDTPEKYAEFWKNFGLVLKEGPAEDFANKESIAQLMRFASTHDNTETQSVSLEAYIARMPEHQKKIYYVAADNFNAAKNSPHLEVFRQKGIEVLLLSERIDEWMMGHLTQYKEKHFQSVAKGSLDLHELQKEGDNKEQPEQTEEEQDRWKAFMERLNTLLKDKVKEVRRSDRLTTSPSCIVADEHDMTAQMKRILKAAGQSLSQKPILEINAEHLLVKKLMQEEEDGRFRDLAGILLDQAILAEGGQLEDPAASQCRFLRVLAFVKRSVYDTPPENRCIIGQYARSHKSGIDRRSE